jgi:4-amino-4-deoxy-L-arabinose transferase-like glycosyltransferase
VAVVSTARSTQAESQIGAPGREGHETQVLLVLALVIVVYTVLASFIAIRTPPFEAADEFGHVDNVETLVSGHWYTIPPRCWSPEHKLICTSNELHQPPLYYLLLAGWQDLVGLAPVPPPTNFGDGPGVIGLRGEVLLRHPDRGLVLWVRFPNIVLGAATILMAFAAGRRVTHDKWTPVVAAAVVAFMPRFVFLSPFVTNDNLVTLLGAVLTWCALSFVRRRSWRWMAATGAVFGLLITTKLSVLPLGLILPLLALAAPSWRRRAWLFACGALSALAASSWYWIQNWVRYGDPLARHATTTYLLQIGGLGTYLGEPYVVRDPITFVLYYVPRKMFSYFWYASGWNQFSWSLSVGIAITCVVGVALLGLIRRSIEKWVLITLGAISVLAFSCVWFVAFQTSTYQTRYALVGLGAMAVLVALALERWRLPIRWLLPCAGLIGSLVAFHQDVLGVHWT